MFDGQNVILIFLVTYAGEKLKLSRDLVGNKFFSFCPVP
jgi:hypothetical protein